ncbi:MAG: ribonuclease HI [Ignavibacteriae bacterium]|nr:ribonuclease HI [Ignavibacteriota bacterium]
MKHVIIHTDGACSGNPGPGGYAAILQFNGVERELSGGFRLTTNNRMELTAAIVALEALKERCRVTLYTDSRYIVDAINKGWAARWKRNRWMRNKTDEALNPDLWERLLALLGKHLVTIEWTRGHAGDPLNERCDKLAVEASRADDLPEDTR